MIALIDYGAGNLASVRKALAAAGATTFSPAGPAELRKAHGIIVPGVGHFDATRSLEAGWVDEIADRVRAGVPILGICLGMQWLFTGSEEAPEVSGLGRIDGIVRRIEAVPPLKVPHVGWNTLAACRPCALLEGVDDGAYVYFAHSFAAPVTPECAASTTHGTTFAAVVERDHVAGVQFHPEKSAAAGIRVLRNFVALTAR